MNKQLEEEFNQKFSVNEFTNISEVFACIDQNFISKEELIKQIKGLNR